MKRKHYQPGLFDAPAWEQEAQARPVAAPPVPCENAKWHRWGACGSASLPCPRCKGMDEEQRRAATILERNPPPVLDDRLFGKMLWVDARAAVLVSMRGMHPADARNKAAKEFAEMEGDQ